MVCDGTDACNGATLACGNASCEIECGPSTVGCDGATVECGPGPCSALCIPLPDDPTLECGDACSCTPC